MRTILSLSLFALTVTACSALGGQDGVPDKTATDTSATEPVDSCPLDSFVGTFAFAKVKHSGDSDYCQKEANDWNDEEEARSLHVWRGVDGSWQSEVVGAENAGTRSYTFDHAACTLKSIESTKFSDKDPQGQTASFPVQTVNTITLTKTGINLATKESLDVGSNIPGLPCKVESSADGARL